MNRTEILSRMSREHWDLLVIGGGISGAGVVREASLRGLKAALVEQNDFASGTSSRSGKMIIGGLRYLLNRDFHLVRKGIRERDWLAAAAPHLVRWRPYLFPVWEGDADSLWKIRFGLTLYDLFGMGGPRRPHEHLDVEAVSKIEPGLETRRLKGAAQYWDCMTDDSRLVIETLQAAVGLGAAVANYAEVAGFQNEAGRVSIALIKDRNSGATLPVRARAILVAAGPWTDHVRCLEDPGAAPLLRLVKGSFIVVPRERLPVTRNVTLRAADGRMTFAVPFGGQTYIGTTEVDYNGPLDEVCASAGEVEYLLTAAWRAFPEAQLDSDDVIATWAGLRPLVGSRSGQNPSQVKRDYSISVTPSGLAILAGGKLTGFRAMAEDVVDRLFAGSRKDAAPAFPGAAGPQPAAEEFRRLADRTEMPAQWIEQKLSKYGSRIHELAAELPATGTGRERWIRAQTRFAVRNEMAQTLIDVLWRRTGVMITEAGNGLDRAEIVAEEMAVLLGWSNSQKAGEVDAYRREVNRMWSWKADAKSYSNVRAETLALK